jgi:hypothetical protein
METYNLFISFVMLTIGIIFLVIVMADFIAERTAKRIGKELKRLK